MTYEFVIGRCLILSWLSFEILSNAASKILSFSGMYNPIEPLNSKSSDVNPNFSGSFSIGASFNSKKLFAAIISMQSVFSVKKFKVFQGLVHLLSENLLLRIQN
ncbi:MAG: hypothetical protein ACLSA2_02450 [Candidatus Gastranaerophilaceae bacterium]